MMLGAAVGLQVAGVLEHLAGRVALIAVPAEEFIDVEYRWQLHQEGKLGLMAGKQEFIRLGAFDDVDMAMMVHTTSRPDDGQFAVGGTSNGHVVKYIRFIGRAAHAGGAPHEGINALQAAMVALNALNAQRETLRNEDNVRLHGILTKGGAAVNSIPADVRYEGRVRGRSIEAIADGNLIITTNRFKSVGAAEAMRLVPPSENLYITIDIDALDPTHAPGTGTPETGGLYYEEMRDALAYLTRNHRLVALDMVEVAPPYDCQQITTMVAARLIISILSAVFPSKEAAEEAPKEEKEDTKERAEEELTEEERV
jgi:hypothetical protein